MPKPNGVQALNVFPKSAENLLKFVVFFLSREILSVNTSRIIC